MHAADDGNFVWWNLGGWENRQTGMEQTLDGGKMFLGDLLANHIESGKWYDIRVEVSGDEIVGYLDNAPIVTAAERPHLASSSSMFAAASRDNKTGDLILKIVNTLPKASLLDITCDGAAAMQNTATLEVLAGKPGDINTLNMPDKISPIRGMIQLPGGTHFSHEFPPYSISVLRLSAR